MLRAHTARCGCELLRLIAMTTVSTRRMPSVHAIGAAQLVAWGATFYAIPPLLPRISSDLAVSTSALSIAITVGLVLNALASLAVAQWIQRRGARVPMMLGSVVAACALVLLAASTAPAVASIALATLGAAQAALLYEPAFAAISTHTADPVTRTRAIQVITFWGGWAALWALPTSSLLAASIGWRVTLLTLAALLVVSTIRVHASLPAPTFRRIAPRAARMPAISIGLATAFALGSFATTAVVVNGVLLLATRHVSLEAASVVFALLAPVQVFGRLWLMRRHGRLDRRDGSIAFVLVGAGVLALLAAPSLVALALFVLLFGAGAGSLTTIRAAVVVVHAPPEHVATHLGAYSFVTSVARAFAPAVSSWLYFDAGYGVALVTFALMAIVAAALIWRRTSAARTDT